MMKLTAIVLTTIFAAIFFASPASAIDITECQTLNVKGEIYELQNNIMTEKDTCFVIEADGIVLDFNGFAIEGIGDFSGHGVLNEGFNSLTLKNGEINNFANGITIRDAKNNIIRGIAFNSNADGISIEEGSHNRIIKNRINGDPESVGSGITFHRTAHNIIKDTTISNVNIGWDLSVIVETDEQCDNKLINVVGMENKPILFYNEEVRLSGLEASEIILCNADKSVLKNIEISKEEGINNGVLYILRTDNAILSDITLDNTLSGVYLSQSDRNLITNCIVKNTPSSGIYFSKESRENKVIECALSNNHVGINLGHAKSWKNVIKNNYIVDSRDYGIMVSVTRPMDNFIYNNFLSNMENLMLVISGMPTGFNNLNIAQQKGPNIIGGPYLGGNYWANPDGTGFSQTCNDDNSDGFCDDAFMLNENNIDLLPLTR